MESTEFRELEEKIRNSKQDRITVSDERMRSLLMLSELTFELAEAKAARQGFIQYAQLEPLKDGLDMIYESGDHGNTNLFYMRYLELAQEILQ